MLPSASNIFPVLLLVGVNHLQRADQKVTSLMKPFLILPPKTWLRSYYSFHSTQTPSIHPSCIDTLLTLGFFTYSRYSTYIKRLSFSTHFLFLLLKCLFFRVPSLSRDRKLVFLLVSSNGGTAPARPPHPSPSGSDSTLSFYLIPHSQSCPAESTSARCQCLSPAPAALGL